MSNNQKLKLVKITKIEDVEYPQSMDINIRDLNDYSVSTVLVNDTPDAFKNTFYAMLKRYLSDLKDKDKLLSQLITADGDNITECIDSDMPYVLFTVHQNISNNNECYIFGKSIDVNGYNLELILFSLHKL